MQRRCTAINAAGQPCGTYALSNSDTCRAHNEQYKDTRLADSARGGMNRGVPAQRDAAVAAVQADPRAHTYSGLREIGAEVLAAAIAGKLAAGQVNAISAILRCQQKILETEAKEAVEFSDDMDEDGIIAEARKIIDDMEQAKRQKEANGKQ